MQKNDRQRIISQTESKLMELLSDDQYTFEIVDDHKKVNNISSFKKVSELQNLDQNTNDHFHGLSIDTCENNELNRCIVLKKKGKPVACSSIVICLEPVVKKIFDEDKPITEYVSNVQFIKFDEQHYTGYGWNYFGLILKILNFIEALSLLHNSTRIQIGAGIMLHNDLIV